MVVERRKLECGLRVVEGAHDGLGKHWRFGIALIDPGRISLPGRTMLLRRAVLVVDVLSVYTSPIRTMGFAWEMSVNPGAPILQVRTADAILDWVIVQPTDLEWAVARLQSHGRRLAGS